MNKRYGMIRRCKILIGGGKHYLLYNVYGNELKTILRHNRVRWGRRFRKKAKQYVETYKKLF